ncbi:Cytochrome P450 CYP82H23 [Vitis vinifera]|uniref:Cytochrome P450 CYP82H23 n=1 Tax=Vitis vinifera TaxID=29760 RepID=A0A438CAZ6_VITVI|nr:Cytochrome P450 CYP82H23 [Vitis vinifera]
MADKHGSIFCFHIGLRKTSVVSSWEVAKECFTTMDKAFATQPRSLAGKLMGYDHAMFGFSPCRAYCHDVRKLASIVLDCVGLYTITRIQLTCDQSTNSGESGAMCSFNGSRVRTGCLSALYPLITEGGGVEMLGQLKVIELPVSSQGLSSPVSSIVGIKLPDQLVGVEHFSSHQLELLNHVRDSEVKLFIKELYGQWIQNGIDLSWSR